MRNGGKNFLGPACARLLWLHEVLAKNDKDGTFRKAFHKGLVSGTEEVSLLFPMSAAANVRENISITVEEESPNLFEQLCDN